MRKRNGVSIGTVSRITELEVHTLRYWESEFQRFLMIERTEGGQRRYSAENIATLFKIKKLLKEDKFTLAGAWRHMKNNEDN
jgi:DNA-binding transcriptional MerR regulator